MQEKLRILILEDEASDADLIKWELEEGKIEFEALVVESKTEFENALTEFLPDIILSDHSLPAFNSLEALKMVRKMEIKIPFILTTGKVSEEFAVEVMRSGADDYILKDRLKRLPAAVNNVLEKYRLANEKIVADQKMKERDANLHAIINNTNDLIFSVDRNYNLLSFNNMFSDIVFAVTGIVLKEGDTFFLEEKSFNIIKEWKEYFNKVLEGEQIVTETVYQFGDKNLFYELSLHPIWKANNIIGIGCVARDISGRKKAQQQQTLLSSIVNLSDDAIISKTMDGIITSWNKGAQSLFGYTDEEAIGKSISLIIPSDRLNEEVEIIEKIKTGEHVRHYETIRKRKNNSFIEISLTVSPIIDELGNVTGASKIARDITVRKEAEKKIRRSEERFRALMENNYDGITLRDENFSILYRNPAAITMLGWTSEDNVTQSLLASSHPDDIENINVILKTVLHNPGKPVPMTFRTKHKDGHFVWIEGVITNMLHDKNVKAFVTNFRDITDRKLAEEALQKSEDRYRQIVETAQDGIWTVNEKNVTTFVNHKLSQIIGYTADDMLGKPVFDFMGDEGMVQAVEAVENWKRGIRQNYEFRYVTKTGEKIWVNISANPILNSDGKYKGALAMVSDITERKKAEDRIRKSEAALKEAQNVAKYGNWNYDIINDELTWSEELHNVFGTDKNTDIKTHQAFLHLVDEEERDFAYQTSLHTQKTGEPFNINYHITTPAGEKRIIHELGYAKFDKEGKVIRLYGTAQDITESKKAETEMLDLNEQFRNLSAHLQTIREEERTDIAREVHDELGQQMTSLKLDIAALKR